MRRKATQSMLSMEVEGGEEDEAGEEGRESAFDQGGVIGDRDQLGIEPHIESGDLVHWGSQACRSAPGEFVGD